MERENLNLKELMHQALETEKGGVLVYQTAIRCAQNKQLKAEWSEYLEQTKAHVSIVLELLETFELDPEETTPGSDIVKKRGEGLVQAMQDALSCGDAAVAQLVAAECVVDAETKDHLNWELLAELARELEEEDAEALRKAVEKVEKEEDRHLYHTAGWARELWLDSIGLPAVLPPPEETKDVDTAIEAAHAKQQRGRMLRDGGTRGRGPGKAVRHA